MLNPTLRLSRVSISSYNQEMFNKNPFVDSDDGFYPNTVRTLYRIQNIVGEFSPGDCDASLFGKL